MKEVKVDKTKCIGCGACVAISPENFDFDNEGFSDVKNPIPNEKTVEAVEACPVFAISIDDNCDEKNKCSCNENCHCEDHCECGDDCNCGEDCDCNNG